MKGLRLLIAIVVTVLLLVSAAAADQALLILKSSVYADTEKTIDQLQKIDCFAQHVFPPRVIIAEVPAGADSKVLELKNVAALYRGKAPKYAVPSGLSAQDAADATAAIGAWNALLEPKPAGAQSVGSPLINDDIPEPPCEGPIPGSISAMATAPSHAPGWNENSSFACGKVAIGIIFPESTGSGENWSTSRLDTCYNKIVSGLNRWTTMAGNSRLSFYYDRHNSVSTTYEPIQYNETYKGDWINDVMSKLGYTSNTWNWKCRQYVNDIRSNLHTDWAEMYFVIDSYNDADGKFPNGSFAWREGCVIFMTYDNDGWGINYMDGVASHELGHIWGAGDEYCQTGNCCGFDYRGYLNIYNGNCEDGNPNSVDCKMKQNTVYSLCSWTKGQCGYQDSNNNGRWDVVDLTVNNTLNAITNPVDGSSITMIGYSNITPCHSPSGWVEVTINKIQSVDVAIDGVWGHAASPTDGAFNLDTEDYTYTATDISPGQHTFQTKVTDDWGNVGYSTVQTIQFNGSDPTPPTAPTNLAAEATDYNTIHLTWTASTDNVGVTGYEIQRNGTAVATVGAVTSFDDTGLSGNTTYSYQVRARDAAGNWSDLSNTTGAKTWVLVLSDPFTSLSSWTAGIVADGTTRGVSLDNGTGSNLSGGSGAPAARSDVGFSGTNGSYSYVGYSAPFAVGYIEGSFYDSATTGNSNNGIAFRKFNGTATRMVYFLGNDTANTTVYSCDVYSASAGWTKHATGGNRAVGWHKFRVFMDGTNVTYYVDGSLKDTIAQPAEKAEGMDRAYIGHNYSVYTTGWFDDVKIVAPTPPAPNAGTPSAIGQSSVTWNFTEGNKDYEQGFYLEDTGGANKGSAGRGAVSITESGLAANTSYIRAVTAYNGPVESLISDNMTAVTLSAPPSGNITSTPPANTPTTGIFTFTSTVPFGAGGVQYYRYAWDQSATHTWTGSETQWSSGTLTRDVTTPANNYYLHVKSYNSNDVENGTLDLGPYIYQAPAAPTSLAANAVSGTTIHLTWTAPTDEFGISNYEIQRNGSVLTTISGTLTSYDDTGLTPGTTYTYQIRAKNGADHWSGFSNSASATTIINIPTVPGNVVATSVDWNIAHLTWTASTDASGITNYEIWRNGAALVTLGNVISFDDSGLAQGTTYSYQVRAKNGEGRWSDLSTAASVKTWSIVLQDPFTNMSNWTASKVADGTIRGCTANTGAGSNLSGGSGAPCAKSDVGGTSTDGSYSYFGYAQPFAVGYIQCSYYDSSTTSNSRNGIAFRKSTNDDIATPRMVYFLGNDQANSASVYSAEVYGVAGGWVKHATGGSRAIGWHRFSISIDGTNVRFYVDGALKDTIAEPAEKGEGVNRFYIGNNYNVNTSANYDDFFACFPTPPVPVPATPSVTSSSITWTWSEGPSDYEQGFYIKDTGGALKGTPGRNTISWTETGLAPNTTYTRTISAFNGPLESPVSITVTATTNP